jgi:hypothetical protein
MRPTSPVPGHLSAAFLSSASTVLLFGVMVPCRSGVLRPMLVLRPVPALGGLICLSYLIWFFLWIVLYSILGGRESVGTLPGWTAMVLGTTLLSSLIAKVSFAWRALVY